MNLKNLTIYFLFALVLIELTECGEEKGKKEDDKGKGKEKKTSRRRRGSVEMTGQGSSTVATEGEAEIDDKELLEFIRNPENNSDQFINDYYNYQYDPKKRNKFQENQEKENLLLLTKMLRVNQFMNKKSKGISIGKPKKQVSGKGKAKEMPEPRTKYTFGNLKYGESINFANPSTFQHPYSQHPIKYGIPYFNHLMMPQQHGMEQNRPIGIPYFDHLQQPRMQQNIPTTQVRGNREQPLKISDDAEDTESDEK